MKFFRILVIFVTEATIDIPRVVREAMMKRKETGGMSFVMVGIKIADLNNQS